MADANIAGKLTLDSKEAIKSIKDLKTELKVAEGTLVYMIKNFGDLSPQALAAARAVAELRDSINDAREVADLFDPGAKFAAFGGAVQAVAGGISALTGAMALFGEESEVAEKALLKVQAAMALSEGLNSILDAGPQFQRLIAIIGQTTVAQKLLAVSTAITSGVFKAFGASVATSSNGFKILRGAIIATGIGALVVLLGTVIANFDSIKAAVLRLFPGLEKLGKFIGAVTQAFTDMIGLTSETERQLDRMTAATERNNRMIDRRIKILTAQGGKEAEIAKDQKRRIDNELALLRWRDKELHNLTQEELRRIGELKDERAIVDIHERNRLEKEAKDAADEAKKKNDQVVEAEKSANKKLQQLRDENRIAAVKDQYEQAVLRAQLEYEAGKREIDELEVSAATKRKLIVELGKKEGQALLDARAERDKVVQEVLDQYAKNLADITANEDKAQKEKTIKMMDAAVAQITTAEQVKAAQKKLEEENTEATRTENERRYMIVADTLGKISEVVGQQTAAGKVFAIAEATINTYLAASKALTGIVKGNPFSAVAAITQAAVIVAAGLKNVREIAKVKVPGGGGSAPSLSASAPAPLSTIPTTSNTQLPQDQINQIGNATVKAFVVESDITNSQDRIKRLSRAARLGG